MLRYFISMLSIAGFHFGAQAEPPVPPSPIVQVLAGVQTGTYLSNPAGLALYTFDRDVGSVSNCYDSCAVAWPPVIITVDVAAPFGKSQRRDGTQQLTYQGKPVYLYVDDAVIGDILGDGLGGVWHLARP